MTEAPAYERPPATVEEMSQAISTGRIAMWCEWPPPYGPVRAMGYLDVGGWAYCRGGLEGVYVYLYGVCYPARLGTERQDLAESFEEDLRYAGFTTTIELDEGHAGGTKVVVVARANDGQTVGVQREIECRPAPSAEDAARLEREWPFELLERAEERQRKAEEMLMALKRSRSWRMTQPLRDVGGLARRVRSRRRAGS